MAETKKTTKKVTVKEEKAPKAPKAKKVAVAPVEEAEVKEAKKTKAPKAKKEDVKEESAATQEVNKKLGGRGASKDSKKKDKEEKTEKTTPTVIEASAKGLSLKATPRKVRLVCDLVRGKSCEEALEILFNTHHKPATMIAKVIKSAMANATNNYNMNEDKLYVSSIMASDSIKMKRFLPRAKGSASGLVKRYTNLYVSVKERI